MLRPLLQSQFLAPFLLKSNFSSTYFSLSQRPLATMAKIHTPIPNLKLNDGNSIPMLGYGTGTAWFKRGDESEVDRDLIAAIKMAIGLDYTHLDGAEAYKTENELGTAIKESKVDRSKLFITTKVTQSTDDIPAAMDRSLKKLGLDYVDLFLIHHPFWAEKDEDLQRAWGEMEQVQAAGKAKSIGVSNYLPHHLDATLKTAKVVPAVNQIEFNPYLQHPPLLTYHKAHGIATVAYAPLIPVTKAAPGPVDDYLAALAKKYAVSEAEVLLRWCIDQDVVPITTSSKEQRLSDYLRVATFKLTPAELREIGELGGRKHYRGFWTAKFDEGDRS